MANALQSALSWLNLVRWRNLLIILLTQLLAWWCVILPEGRNGPLLLHTANFLCIALSTMLIAAAGYIINDYFDVKIDNINHPEKVILGKLIPRKTAIILHSVLNFIALLLAAYVARQAHHYEWLLLQLFCTVLLWFYSTAFKRQYVTGNVVVALLTAFTVLALVLYEPVLQHDLYKPMWPAPADRWQSLPVWVLIVYAVFAFLLTWIREVVKDMEDLKGDEAEGCMTMPIKIGLRGAMRFCIVLAVIVVLLLLIAVISLSLYVYHIFAAYTFIFLLLPLVAWILYLPRGIAPAHYAKASRALKVIMVLGIVSLLIYHWEIYSVIVN